MEQLGSWQAIKQRWLQAMATTLALLVKEMEDGSTKISFIEYVLRSGLNAMIAMGERIVLPSGPRPR